MYCCSHLFFIVAVSLAVMAYSAPMESSAYENYCKFGDETEKPRTCLDLLCRGMVDSGVNTVYPYGNDVYSFDVFCDQKTDGGGWTVFQRRMNGYVDFYRNWQNYKLGFGEVNAEHWLGNDKIHLLLSLNKANKLRVDMEAVSNERAYAQYSNFSMGDESTGYVLGVSGYTGTAGDSLVTGVNQVHSGQKFTTLDRDNDALTTDNCALLYKGGWWYDKCHDANLNGRYLNGVHKSFADGVNWETWKGNNESLKTAEMKLRANLN